MDVLSHLDSGEAKLLGIMVDNLTKDVTRVENVVNDINAKMDILGRIEVTMAGFNTGLAKVAGDIAALDDRVDDLEAHRDVLVKAEETGRWSISTWLNVVGILAAIGLVAADIAGLFHR